MESKLELVARRNPHLYRYLVEFYKKTKRRPAFYEQLSRAMADLDEVNILYPVGDPIFVHIFGKGEAKKYIAIEPMIDETQYKKIKRLLDIIFEKMGHEELCDTKEKLERTVSKVLENAVIVTKQPGLRRTRRKKLVLTPLEYEHMKYLIKRDIIENGLIEPLIRDPYLEDLHCTGPNKPIAVFHKVFGTMETNLRFRDYKDLEQYVSGLGEKSGKPVTTAHPIVDTAMSDGSRLNIIYADDVSIKGPTFTIRKFAAEPLSITQLVDWKTLSPELAAYVWIALENNMNLLICGETASGKTTTLNASIPFINRNQKIYSVEDTAELLTPHRVWQRLLTRESGREETRVDHQALLRASFRSRPDYIIVGEIRGPEGAVAFQAMQAGGAVLSTFHADSVSRVVQRFTGNPINVPIRFLDNLNIILIQQAIYLRGKAIRRCTSLSEILGYSAEANSIITRDVFVWNRATDTHRFRGMYNSYVLENLIAAHLGYADKRMIYDELATRAKIIENMVRFRILSYHEVADIFQKYQLFGVQGLPFNIG